MAVHIRLQRKGTTNRSFFHIVAADHRARRDGKFIEKLGYYDPNTEPSTINIKADRLNHWFGCGAQMSDTVKKLVKVLKIDTKRVSSK